ncbi:MAG: ATP-dependent sacrificial sulfur transferase LarE [Oscillospiraceae bacterium]|nr:ATP-dependent sacrificial sulfur transferase LarE [Oscillospiraceae bacterium]
MKLNEFFALYSKVAVAFSGGVDSSYLLYSAKRNGAEVKAYYVKSAFQPQFELDDAVKLSKELNIPMKILNVDVLSSNIIAENPIDRCYYCKRIIFEAIKQAAKEDGFSVLLDGTNASDSKEERPGMRATEELSVLSPLKECGLTKEEIRRLSCEAGLFTWNKPAYACLATRISTGEAITEKKLKTTEAAEDFLLSLGLTDFRVRTVGNDAKIQASLNDIDKVLENRNKICHKLKQYYSNVLLDLEVRE